MKSKHLSMTFLLLTTIAPLYAADINNGMELHKEHCMRCHQPEIYTRQNRIVNNLEQLQKRVRECELANDLTWFEEDVEDVIAFLNANFYMFGIK